MGVTPADIAEGEWPDQPVDIQDSEFNEALERWPTAIVDFWAPWCGPCRAIAPALATIAADLKGQVAVLKINIDHNQSMAGQHGVMSIPTLLYVKDGEVTDRSMGSESPASLRARADGLLA